MCYGLHVTTLSKPELPVVCLYFIRGVSKEPEPNMSHTFFNLSRFCGSISVVAIVRHPHVLWVVFISQVALFCKSEPLLLAFLWTVCRVWVKQTIGCFVLMQVIPISLFSFFVLSVTFQRKKLFYFYILNSIHVLTILATCTTKLQTHTVNLHIYIYISNIHALCTTRYLQNIDC